MFDHDKYRHFSRKANIFKQKDAMPYNFFHFIFWHFSTKLAQLLLT